MNRMWEFCAAVVLAVSGAGVTYWAVQRTQKLADLSERRRMRRDVLRKLVGTRRAIVREVKHGEGEFYAALNEVVVAFGDDDEVMEELRKFYERLDQGFQPNNFLLLSQAMAIAAEMGQLDEFLLERPFAPNQSTDQQEPSAPQEKTT